MSESFFSKKEQPLTSICVQTIFHLPSIHIVIYLPHMSSKRPDRCGNSWQVINDVGNPANFYINYNITIE